MHAWRRNLGAASERWFGGETRRWRCWVRNRAWTRQRIDRELATEAVFIMAMTVGAWDLEEVNNTNLEEKEGFGEWGESRILCELKGNLSILQKLMKVKSKFYGLG